LTYFQSQSPIHIKHLRLKCITLDTFDVCRMTFLVLFFYLFFYVHCDLLKDVMIQFWNHCLTYQLLTQYSYVIMTRLDFRFCYLAWNCTNSSISPLLNKRPNIKWIFPEIIVVIFQTISLVWNENCLLSIYITVIHTLYKYQQLWM